MIKALQINEFDNALKIGQDQLDLGNYFEAMSVYDQTLSLVMSTSSTKQDCNDSTLHHFAELLTRTGICHTSVGKHIECEELGTFKTLMNFFYLLLCHIHSSAELLRKIFGHYPRKKISQPIS